MDFSFVCLVDRADVGGNIYEKAKIESPDSGYEEKYQNHGSETESKSVS